METTNLKTGWSIKAWIEVKAISTYAFIDEWKCDKTGEKLEAECLLVSKQNFKHRGNETDELYKYNRSSSPSEYEGVWDKWDKIKESKKQLIQNIIREYNLNVTIK